MAIGEKMIEVMRTCRYMPKDGYNSFQKYKYTTAAGMFAKINEALTEQGLFTSTEIKSIQLSDATTSKGNTEKFAVVELKIHVTDAETGEQITFEGAGSGQDAGDKAIMKANTAALKYAYIGGLCIAMSDDPEQDSNTDAYQNYTPQKNQTKPNGNEIAGKCDKCGKAITSKVAEYSQKKFGKKLCYDCQKGDAAEPF
mgnify:CR=1 FL=1